MKTQNLKKSLIAIAAVTALLTTNIAAQDSSTTSTTAQAAPAPLSPAASQVLQLAQAKVSDSTIVAYIQNSGTIYALDASQIVYLRQQGVSDGVVTTMLNQRSRVAPAAQTAPSQNYSADTGGAQASTATVQPTVTYVQPASSVYVIPDTQTYNYNAYYYQPYYQPYYYPYYGYPFPVVSFGFGFGGRFHGGGDFHGGDGHHH
jgi:hypothetical protein